MKKLPKCTMTASGRHYFSPLADKSAEMVGMFFKEYEDSIKVMIKMKKCSFCGFVDDRKVK